MSGAACIRRGLFRLANYGMLPVLALLVVMFSVQTITEQHPEGAAAGRTLAAEILRTAVRPRVVAVAQAHDGDTQFVNALVAGLAAGGGEVVATARGDAAEAGRIFASVREPIAAVACTRVTAGWPVVRNAAAAFPALAGTPVMTPPAVRWPQFLMPANIRNIANSISIIAIIAIGMTLVIIAGGIDLSVGSLIALAAVLATLLIRDGITVGPLRLLGGDLAATPMTMVVASVLAVTACGLLGLMSGGLITGFRLPPFIVTLAMMLIARGMAKDLTQSESVYQIPAGYTWLGGQASLWGIPNAVVLMLVLYAAAWVLMHRTVYGRYLYAVGGNAEAARLSGVPVTRVLLVAYFLCGLLAGVGGIVMASRTKSGSATYGEMYELSAIAAVVVGGTSISGGEGSILGTLIGAFIIAVIETGMNLTHVPAERQPIVLGSVILGAVLLDRLKQWAWRRRSGPVDEE
ncbi:MAG: ABC transporter permease [Planctomycetota bacterium]